jgi:hypothetical protein
MKRQELNDCSVLEFSPTVTCVFLCAICPNPLTIGRAAFRQFLADSPVEQKAKTGPPAVL